MTPRFSSLPARRKGFLGGAALLAVVAVCALAISISVGRDRATARVTLPASPASAQAAGPAQDDPGPVILVPGYGGGTYALSQLAARIRATGRTAIIVHLPGAGTGSLVRNAEVLNQTVRAALRGGAPSVDVVGYSAGGVTTLIWARDDDGERVARRIVTLGSPYHGTVLAAAAQGFAPGACPAACLQLLPGSPLLTTLGAQVPGRIPWLSLWSIDDKIVRPPASARLTGARNVPIQSICPKVRVSHGHLPDNTVVSNMVLQAIAAGPLHRPTTAACGTPAHRAAHKRAAHKRARRRRHRQADSAGPKLTPSS
jgi:triacylglycerol lipase